MLQDHFPAYSIVETLYVSARNNILYQVIAKALANQRVNMNFGIFKKVLLRLHRTFTDVVSEERGAHLVAVLGKIH